MKSAKKTQFWERRKIKARFDEAFANKTLVADDDFDKLFWSMDLVQLRGFFNATQEHIIESCSLEHDGPVRHKFLARLQGEISKRGVIDVLRNGMARRMLLATRSCSLQNRSESSRSANVRGVFT